MNKQKTLIFFGAHPDDETFGMGATLAQYAKEGVKVYYVCSPAAKAGTVDPEYMQGLKQSPTCVTPKCSAPASVLGLTGVIYLAYRDSGMTGSPDNQNPASLFMALSNRSPH